MKKNIFKPILFTLLILIIVNLFMFLNKKIYNIGHDLGSKVVLKGIINK